MMTTPKRSVSPFFFVAFVLAGFFIWATIQNNLEIAERRLAEPVLTDGTLTSTKCMSRTSGWRGGGIKRHIELNYQYVTVGSNPTQHDFRTLRWVAKEEDCVAFDKSSISQVTIWYEKEHPEKASLYENEPSTWGFLYGLILAVLFVLFGVYDQKSINKKKRESQKEKRALNILNRARKS